MLELLDIRTFAISTALILSILAVVMLVYQTHRKIYRGFRSWVWAQIMFALAYLMFGTRNILPDLFSIIIGNSVLLAGFFFARQGYRKFFDRHPYTKRSDIILLVLVILSLFVFTYVYTSYQIRTIIISIVACWVCMQITWELVWDVPNEMKPGAFFGAFFFELVSLITLHRMYEAITQPEQVDFLLPTLANISIYALAIFVATASSFAALMLTSTRLELELKMTQDELELLANTDPLTGLYNRRYFKEVAQQEFVRARRFNQSFGILFADLDHFKSINDTYGHDRGDAVLAHIAHIIKRQVRQVDVVARLGGEEFIVLLIQSNEQSIPDVARRVREAIEKNIVEMDGDNIQCTVSIGISSLSSEDNSIEDIIKRADSAMYVAKENGRNRVQFK